ncbi:MAG TPA: cytochrome c oxidase subunit II [Xanthobacteraceae bacterium]|nr:cytochrome c oxidase subunit II [Xanthobacteraceae bacterium]
MFELSRLIALGFAMVLAAAGVAHAGLGQPSAWQLGLQDAGSPVMEEVVWFHNYVLAFIAVITMFVLALLLTVIVRFNGRANPNPSRTTHSTSLEIAWTVLPVVILVFIAVPSFRLLFHQLNIPKSDLTVKATGNQWYWSYTYPDEGNLQFTSNIVEDAKLKPGQPRLLTVDNELVVPVNKVVRVQVIGSDVIHSFAVPSFGIKIDAIPGRLNETWFEARREGVYYGQCSELCGKNHAFMPIAVRVTSEKGYADWLATAKKDHARNEAVPPTAVAEVPASTAQ